ncbi:SAM-dependent methyltransferase [Halosegnis rubeus]|uniref:SAM-dependent methyltransferase n=1 Tax=Halosegnis rubeus TaxID=2212850 RepID=A0A5N5U9P8_9EURY|nr:SAM-dependent methyltransferase [Halosegnis rubeus]KAB7515267.1 SAM-dependent methyltransferase [Halosegnis rubeus]KAB7517691.1 SAM-dependent methyltransferase [Halosegnis rubeus]
MALDASTRELLLLAFARRRGILETLTTDAGTPEAVAEATDTDPSVAEAVTTALADRGFLERVGREYEPTNRLLGFLTKTDVRSIGSLPATLDALDAWTDHDTDPERTRVNRLGEQWARDEHAVRAAVTAAVHAAPTAERVVCLRDGPGRHASEFATRGYDATILESTARGDTVAPLLAPTEVRLEIGGYDTMPQTDLAFAVGMLARSDDDRARRWLAAAGEAAPTVVCIEPVRDRSPEGALLDVEHHLRDGGRVRPESALRSLFADVGLDCSVTALPGTEGVALVGRRVQ